MPKSKFKLWTIVISGVIATAMVFYININERKPDRFPLEIDLSKFSGNSQLKFIVPKENYPTYHGGNYFEFYADFERSQLANKKIGPSTTNHLNIIVRVEKENKHLRSVYSIRNAIRRSTLTGERAGFTIYEEHIGKNGQTRLTHYIKSDISGLPVIITQAGDLNLRTYRAISNDIELDYVFSSQLGIENWEELDGYILDKLASFMGPPKKSVNSQP